MTLQADLARATSEEDGKDACFKALFLEAYYRNLIDIQRPEVWFEAKGVAGRCRH